MFPRRSPTTRRHLRRRPRIPSSCRRLPTARCTWDFRSSRFRPLEKRAPVSNYRLRSLQRPRQCESCQLLGFGRALGEDRYNLHALNWRQFLAERYGTPAEQQLQLTRRSRPRHRNSEPARNPCRCASSLSGRAFIPTRHIQSNNVTVHDYSQFRVTMTNTSRRPVVIESVQLSSRGTAAAAALGDVKNYWNYPSGAQHLDTGRIRQLRQALGLHRGHGPRARTLHLPNMLARGRRDHASGAALSGSAQFVRPETRGSRRNSP